MRWGALIAAALLSLSAPAWAGDRAAAEASFARAEQAAKERRYADALAAYRAVGAADPSAAVATPARARAEDLEAHREGGFAPLARLDEVRRDVARGRDPDAVEALARDMEAFPPGRVRAEARIFVAEAWWRRLGQPARAIEPFERAVADTSGDRVTRALALSELCALRRERGEVREALRAAEADPELSPALRAELARLVRRGWLRWVSTAWLAALGLVGAGSAAALALRARDVRDVPGKIVRPLSLAFALYVGGAGALLVRAHGEADARPFVWLGLSLLALDVAARAFRLLAGRRAVVRAAWAVACVAGVLAAAFLSVERTSAEYLDGIGL